MAIRFPPKGGPRFSVMTPVSQPSVRSGFFSTFLYGTHPKQNPNPMVTTFFTPPPPGLFRVSPEKSLPLPNDCTDSTHATFNQRPGRGFFTYPQSGTPPLLALPAPQDPSFLLHQGTSTTAPTLSFSLWIPRVCPSLFFPACLTFIVLVTFYCP